VRFDAFVGGSYESQAATADVERTVNWYPEKLQSAGATAQTVLYPTPGVDRLATATTGGVGRAHFYQDGREFAVIGAVLYEVDSSGALTNRGTLALDDRPATITTNGDGGGQLWITSGGNGYCYDLDTNILTQVTAMDGKCSQGGFCDGYFLALDANTSTLYLSALFDGLTWAPGLDFAQRSLAPDRWRAMIVANRMIWLFGTETSEVWYDTGDTFPFAPHPSGLIQYGILAPSSAAIAGTEVLWLASMRSGRVAVIKATGFTPEVISHYPFEHAAQQYSDVTGAIADVYSEAGHTFYVLSFDLDRRTWAWDAETNLWSERASWHPEQRQFTTWRPRYYARAFNQHRILDASGAHLYRMGVDLTGDVDGLEIRRLRRAPAIVKENKLIFYRSFELDLEPGLGSAEAGGVTDEAVDWTGLDNATDDGAGTLTKAADNTDPAGAYSVQVINAGPASISTTIGKAYVDTGEAPSALRFFGLTTAPSSVGSGHDTWDYAWLDFGFMLQYTGEGVGGLQVSEGGNTLLDPAVDTAQNDVLRIDVSSGGVVTYYQNDVLVYTSATAATFPLYVVGDMPGRAASGYISLDDCTIQVTEDPPPEYDPHVMLRVSNDGGKTWITEQMRSAGRQGEWLKRVRWTQLGAATRRVFEVSVSDPIPWRLMGAYLEAAEAKP